MSGIRIDSSHKTINERVGSLLKWLITTDYNWCIFEWCGAFYKLFRNGQMRLARMDEVYKYPRGTPNDLR